LRNFANKGEIKNERLENDLIFGVSIVKSLEKKKKKKRVKNKQIFIFGCYYVAKNKEG
jgi:hypothetical protein